MWKAIVISRVPDWGNYLADVLRTQLSADTRSFPIAFGATLDVEQPEEINLVVADFHNPVDIHNQSTRLYVGRLEKLFPKARIVLATSFPENRVEIKEAGAEYLDKGSTLDQLLQTLRGLLHTEKSR